MNRRHLLAGVFALGLGQSRVSNGLARGALIGLGLTGEQFEWMYGEPDDTEPSESGGNPISVYNFAAFTIKHGFSANELVWRLECHPHRPADFNELTDYIKGFLPSDAVLLSIEELQMAEADIWGKYHSAVLEDTVGPSANFQPPGGIDVAYFRDGGQPLHFIQADLLFAVGHW